VDRRDRFAGLRRARVVLPGADRLALFAGPAAPPPFAGVPARAPLPSPIVSIIASSLNPNQDSIAVRAT